MNTKTFSAVDTKLSTATDEATKAAQEWIQDQIDRSNYSESKIVTSLAITPTGRYAFTITVLMHIRCAILQS
jgi:hypothetical protein